MSNIQNTIQNPNLEIFRKGFNSFEKMIAGENFLTFKTRSEKLAQESAKDAEKRIEALGLPLQVKVALYNSFIVIPKN